MLLWSATAGLLLAAAYSLSPLTVLAFAAGVVLCRRATTGLPPDERRALAALLAAALGARLLAVMAIFLSDLPGLNDLSVGALAGDEAYYLGRALRARDILLGFADGKYDYFVATDEYGRTSYLTLLTWAQVAFGPTPYGMRLVNGLLFVGGATMAFHLVRESFGRLPAFGGLTVLLFLPSLFAASVSLLKESLYFFVASVLLVAVVRTAEAWSFGGRGKDGRRRRALGGIVLAAVCLWQMNDLRRGALVLAAAGIALGLAIRFVGGHRWRVAMAAAILTMVAGVAAQESNRSRLLDAVAAVAKRHAGHVFTVGHAYKLMDEGFYVWPESPAAWDLRLTEPQAARFLLRAATTFLVTPLPWEVRSVGELLFLPEHLFWYALVVSWPIGWTSGWRRHPLLASLLAGFALPMAAVLAVTTGNVGTLLRLRGLVTPYLVWTSVLGALTVANWLTSRGESPRGAVPMLARSGDA